MIDWLNPTFWTVLGGNALIAVSTALVGCFALLRKRALSGDAVAHALLPGVCLAFIAMNEKEPISLIIGSFITGWLSLQAISWLKNHTIIKEDTGLAISLSSFFGLGVVLLSYIQANSSGNQSGLNQVLFGQAASIVGNDLYVFSALAVLLIVIVVFLYKEFKLLTFDSSYGLVIGFNIKLLDILLSTLTVLAIVVGIEAVGAILMAALLITPAAAARFWTHQLWKMLLLAMLFGLIAAFMGTYISYLYDNMPTGPWMVVTVSAIAIISFLIAPKKGLVAKLIQQRRNRLKIIDENILKTFFHLLESGFKEVTEADLQARRVFHRRELKEGINRLKKNKLIKTTENGLELSQDGIKEGKRIVRIHRLWEAYLSHYMEIKSDHVHEDADAMEHIITPELEQELINYLDQPEYDPHGSVIP